MQHTMNWIAVVLFLGLSGGLPSHALHVGVGSGTETSWPVSCPRNLYIEGTMNIVSSAMGFEQSASFTAAVRGDTVLFTAMGPFGIVVARVYAQPDSFLVVNYLQQFAVDGDPRSAKISDVLPIPIRLEDVLSIVRCMPPGSPSQYSNAVTRDDGAALYTRKDTLAVEYALIDNDQKVIKQFQRKKLDGSPVLNVQYGDVRSVAREAAIPHKIKVRVNDGEHEVTLEYESISTEIPKNALAKLQVPRSYSRTSLR